MTKDTSQKTPKKTAKKKKKKKNRCKNKTAITTQDITTRFDPSLGTGVCR